MLKMAPRVRQRVSALAKLWLGVTPVLQEFDVWPAQPMSRKKHHKGMKALRTVNTPLHEVRGSMTALSRERFSRQVTLFLHTIMSNSSH